MIINYICLIAGIVLAILAAVKFCVESAKFYKIAWAIKVQATLNPGVTRIEVLPDPEGFNVKIYGKGKFLSIKDNSPIRIGWAVKDF